MMDQNRPAKLLDTAYNALKSNPAATNQIMQAAAQGAPVGLKGLAAAAAQQSQQQAQQAMAALQQRGPQPNVIQQLAHAGIMSQMDTGLPGAPVQEEIPQMMAGGGLVAFADGGNVLPPDVIEAIQSHFAEGGDVRGFAYGDDVRSHEYPLRPIGEEATPSYVDGFTIDESQVPDVTYADVPTVRKKGAGEHVPKTPSFFALPELSGFNVADVLPSSGYWQRPGADPSRAAINELASKLKGSGAVKSIEALFDRAAGAKERWGQRLSDIEARHARHQEEDKGLGNLLGSLGVTGFAPPKSEKPKAEEAAGLDYDLAPEVTKDIQRAAFKTATYKPEAQDGHEVTPRQEVHEEGQKLDKTFEQGKTAVPSAATTSGVAGLGAGVDMEKMRDLIIGLGGHREMTPEVKAKLEDLESGARTSTILQSLLGGLGAGLTNPYGGRFALGKAALGALSGYQHGIGSEEEMNRKAFDVLRGYADAPEEEKTKARDLLFGQLGKAAELQSARDIAEARGDIGMEKAMLQAAAAERRANIMAGSRGGTQDIQTLQLLETMTQNELKEDTDKEYYDAVGRLKPGASELAYSRALQKLSARQGLGGGTLGGGQLGSRPPIIQ